MPIRETEIIFDEEIDSLESERQELAEKVASAPDDHPQLKKWVSRGQELDAHLDGLEWARDYAHEDDDVPQWDADVDAVTLSGLTGGEYGGMEADVTKATANSDRGVAGAQRAFQVRAGTVDAPYLDDSMTDNEALASVAGLPVGFLKWAESKVDELSTVGNDDRSDFSSLVAEKQTEQIETS